MGHQARILIASAFHPSFSDKMFTMIEVALLASLVETTAPCFTSTNGSTAVCVSLLHVCSVSVCVPQADADGG